MPRKPIPKKSRSKSAPSRTVKTSKRVAPITRKQFRVSPERKMDIIGVLMAAAGLLMLLSFFSTEKGLVTTWISTALRQLAGWGAVVISAALLLTGLWLLFRHAERFPRISAGRITGIALLYLNLLGWFGYAVPGFDAAKAGSAGGYIGGGIYWLLSQALGRAGSWFALAAGTLIAVVFIVDLSVPEIASRIGALFGKLLKPAPRPQLKNSDSAAHKAKVPSAAPLPEGFAPIDYSSASTIDRAAAGLRRHGAEQAPRSSASAHVPQGVKDTSPAPVLAARVPEKPWTLPPVDAILDPATPAMVQTHFDKDRARTIEETLASFGAPAHVVEIHRGPTITQFGVEPDFIETRGSRMRVRVSKIVSLADDLALALAAPRIRIQAPVPGRSYVGIEVPNTEISRVALREVLESEAFRKIKSSLKFALGKDVSGKPVCADLAKMPHLLIAGTTGSGKSVCINTIIVGILMTKRPDEVKLILVDPKMVEMTSYATVPHLMCPIVTETQVAVQILEWATVKMDERYALLAEARVKNIAEFNKLGPEEVIARFDPSTPEEEAKIPKKLPYMVIIIDELADLMMTASKEIESYIVRLAQKSRAVGIHIVLATQRPQATVVTGLIKSNMPCRVGFRVAARMDSRIILDQNGAETLLGEGDMLFLKPGTSDLIRAQGTFLDDAEIRRIVKHLKDVAEPQFHPELTQLRKVEAGELPQDDLFDQAVRVVLETKRGSVSLLQRRLGIGYARASRIIEMMAGAGILGDYKGSQAREVLMTIEDYEQLLKDLNAGTQMTFDGMEDPAPEPNSVSTYATEGQQGYMSTEVDEEEVETEEQEEELEA